MPWVAVLQEKNWFPIYLSQTRNMCRVVQGTSELNLSPPSLRSYSFLESKRILHVRRYPPNTQYQFVCRHCNQDFGIFWQCMKYTTWIRGDYKP
jgi:hypothetical protein